MTAQEQRRLVVALGRPFVETHISYVLLTDEFAYKIKKAVRFPFLDFTTLSQRRFFCHEEVRLNQPLAPFIYLGVVAIGGTPDAPVLEGGGGAVEYAVKMRKFDQAGLLSRVIERDELTRDMVDTLAGEVAAFHQRTPRAGADVPYGAPEYVRRLAHENFTELLPSVADVHDRSRLEHLRDWTGREAARLAPAFASRWRDGFVRECHGDLHLGNITLVNGRVTLFDRIEFNAAMRWSDVLSDVAFLVMDLRARHRPDLAARFLNTYLERTSDYDGLAVLPFYIVYRAMVRAKVAGLQHVGQDFQSYLALAVREANPRRPLLVITHGVTGSGKSVRAQALVESMEAIRVRSDVERKRMFGLDAKARSGSAPGDGLYTEDASRRTYARLAALARTIVSAGYTVILDAAFLKRGQRDLLRAVADELAVPFTIAECSAPLPVLRERVTRRLDAGHDPSEATLEILERQLAADEPLAPEELRSRQ